MGDPVRRRLVPRWFDAYPELARIADHEGWQPVEPAPDADWVAGWRAEPGTLVLWHEDDETSIEFVTVEGPSSVRVEQAIRAGMQLLTPDAYASAVESERTPLPRGRMLMAVAIAAQAAYDERAFTVIAGALGDENPYIRRYGLYATQLLGWPELWKAAERLRSDDPESAVRATAEEVLATRRTPE